MHSTYSPNLETSYYYLFQSMATNFVDQKFALREGCENRLFHCNDNELSNKKVYIWPKLDHFYSFNLMQTFLFTRSYIKYSSLLLFDKFQLTLKQIKSDIMINWFYSLFKHNRFTISTSSIFFGINVIK